MKVLIIDDSFHSRRYAEFMLQQLSCEVYTAESGEVGLEISKNVEKSLDVTQFVSKKLPASKQFKYFQKCIKSSNKTKGFRRSYAA